MMKINRRIKSFISKPNKLETDINNWLSLNDVTITNITTTNFLDDKHHMTDYIAAYVVYENVMLNG